MDFGQILANINYWAVLVSALSAFVVGWLWYGPIFGDAWMKLHGYTEEDMKGGSISMPVSMLLNYIAIALAALVIAIFIGADSNAGFGILVGIMIAVFWIGTNRLNDVLYEKKPLKLYLINFGYNVIIYALMGAILGGWH